MRLEWRPWRDRQPVRRPGRTRSGRARLPDGRGDPPAPRPAGDVRPAVPRSRPAGARRGASAGHTAHRRRSLAGQRDAHPAAGDGRAPRRRHHRGRAVRRPRPLPHRRGRPVPLHRPRAGVLPRRRPSRGPLRTTLRRGARLRRPAVLPGRAPRHRPDPHRGNRDGRRRAAGRRRVAADGRPARRAGGGRLAGGRLPPRHLVRQPAALHRRSRIRADSSTGSRSGAGWTSEPA